MHAEWHRFVWRLAGGTIVAAGLITVAGLRPASITREVSASGTNTASGRETTMPWFIVHAPPVQIQTKIRPVRNALSGTVAQMRVSIGQYVLGGGPFSTRQEAESYNHEHPAKGGVTGRIVEAPDPVAAVMAIAHEDTDLRRTLLGQR